MSRTVGSIRIRQNGTTTKMRILTGEGLRDGTNLAREAGLKQKTLIDRGEISAGCGITVWGKLKRNAGLNMPKVEFLIKTVQYLSC